MPSLYAQGITERISLWLSSRSKAKKRLTLSQKNIYIFPTKLGFGFTLLLLLMLLTAINYQNSLIYLFTFVLGGIFFVSIWMCFLNVRGLSFFVDKESAGFSGEKSVISITVHSSASDVFGLTLAIDQDGSQVIDIGQGETRSVSIPYKFFSRGRYDYPKILIETRFPFGLIRGWSWVLLDASLYVYPKPVQPLEKTMSLLDGGDQLKKNVSDEPGDLGNYVSGDSINRIAWKQYASKDLLLTRKPQQGSYDPVWLDIDGYGAVDLESALSFLCHEVLLMDKARKTFGMRLGDKQVQPSYGQDHKITCLKKLAEYRKVP